MHSAYLLPLTVPERIWLELEKSPGKAKRVLRDELISVPAMGLLELGSEVIREMIKVYVLAIPPSLDGS